jgi:hypothetical protein
MVIFEGKVYISTWYTDTLPRDWSITLSDKGWTDNSLGLTWLTDVFKKYTKDRTKGVIITGSTKVITGRNRVILAGDCLVGPRRYED